ncbi:MAG: HAD family hydrolase [Lentihominibacter sp.]
MAFGDYFNDMEMLQNCTESYCMENGHPTIKATAKHIAQSNDDNGVMKVLNTL